MMEYQLKRQRVYALLSDPKPSMETFCLMFQYDDWQARLKQWRKDKMKSDMAELTYKWRPVQGFPHQVRAIPNAKRVHRLMLRLKRPQKT